MRIPAANIILAVGTEPEPEGMIEFSTAQEKFLAHLQSKSKITKGYVSDDTQRTYRRGLECFWVYITQAGAPGLERVSPDHMRAYLESLRDRSQAPATIALQRVILKSFFKWASGCYKHIDDITQDIEGVRPNRSESPHMTWVQVSSLLDYLWKDAKARKRDAILFEILARTGARVAEAAHLDLDSVAITDTTIEISLLGKGNKHRAITLQSSPGDPSEGIARFRSRLEEYLRKRARRPAAPGHEEALFLTNLGNRIRPRNIQAAFDYYRQHLNLQAFTPHSLRHAYITRLLQLGVDVATVAKLAGHSSPNITLSVYAHTDPGRLLTAAAKAFD